MENQEGNEDPSPEILSSLSVFYGQEVPPSVKSDPDDVLHSRCVRLSFELFSNLFRKANHLRIKKKQLNRRRDILIQTLIEEIG